MKTPNVGLIVRGRNKGLRTSSTYKLQLLQAHDYIDQGKIVVVVAKDIRIFMGDFTHVTGTHVFSVQIAEKQFFIVKWNISLDLNRRKELEYELKKRGLKAK